MMKRILTLLSLSLFLAACEEEYIGQYPTDNEAPSKVSNAQVENLPGKVKITYSLPKDTDLLYVKAVYKDAQGKKQEVKASNFKNNLILKGFARSKSQTVSLVSVDRSQNESEPLTVEVEPLDAPIYGIMESIKIEPSWGGMKLSWNNPEQEQIFMYVTTPGEDGSEKLVETIISSAADGAGAIRGLEAVETEFKVYIRDVYQNYTDTLTTSITPLYEKFLEPSKFSFMPLATNMNWHKSRHSADALFNGSTTDSKTHYLESKVKNDIAYTAYFTVDLGAVYKFSRIKYWDRKSYWYDLHSPKHFQFWGTDDPVAAADPNSFEGWTCFYDGWSKKPSGLDNPDITDEDLEYAKAGQEIEIAEDAPATRYFRFVSLETWTQSNTLNLQEMEFYGAELN